MSGSGSLIPELNRRRGLIYSFFSHHHIFLLPHMKNCLLAIISIWRSSLKTICSTPHLLPIEGRVIASCSKGSGIWEDGSMLDWWIATQFQHFSCSPYHCDSSKLFLILQELEAKELHFQNNLLASSGFKSANESLQNWKA